MDFFIKNMTKNGIFYRHILLNSYTSSSKEIVYFTNIMDQTDGPNGTDRSPVKAFIRIKP